MKTAITLSIAFLLSYSTSYANSLGLTADQLNSILNSENPTPTVNKAPIRHKENTATSLDKYVESAIRNIKPMITGGYIGNLDKGEKDAYPKALKEIKTDCHNLSVRVSDMNKKKMNSKKLQSLKADVATSCYRKVLKAFTQDIPTVKEYLKWEKRY